MVRNTLSKIKLSICKEWVTGRGGFLILGELWEHLGLSGLLDRHLPQPGSGRGFRPSAIVRSISNILFNGGEYLSDIRSLDSDSALREFCGLEKFPAPNILTSWLNRCERWVESENCGGLQNVALQGLERVNRELLGYLARAMKKTGLIVDINATVVKTAKRTAKIAYNGVRGYQPQLAFLPELRAFVASDFCIGNEPCSKAVVSYLEHCKVNMREGTHVRMVRGDAAYYQRAVMNWCKDNGSDFLIRAGKNTDVMRAIRSIPGDEWEPYVDTDGIERADMQVGGTWLFSGLSAVFGRLPPALSPVGIRVRVTQRESGPRPPRPRQETRVSNDYLLDMRPEIAVIAPIRAEMALNGPQ